MRAFLGGTLGAIVGFFLAVLQIWPFLAFPVFDIYWGPLSWTGLLAPISMPLWWAFLFFAAFTRRRKMAVILYFMHVVSGPVARYVLTGEAPVYLLKIHQPVLLLAWSPMLAFTVWYFTMAFGIRWGEVVQHVRARWCGWRGRAVG